MRSGLALLALTDRYPELVVPQSGILEVIERELALARPEDDRRFREHIFNLLALALEREPVRIAALAVDSGDAHVRGAALEYLETVLAPRIFAALAPRLSAGIARGPHTRSAEAARAKLLNAAATIHISRDDVRRELSARDLDSEA